MIHQQRDVLRIKLSKRSQSKKVTYPIFPFIWYTGKSTTIATKIKLVVCRGEDRWNLPHYIDSQDNFLRWQKYLLYKLIVVVTHSIHLSKLTNCTTTKGNFCCILLFQLTVMKKINNKKKRKINMIMLLGLQTSAMTARNFGGNNLAICVKSLKYVPTFHPHHPILASKENNLTLKKLYP